MKGRASKSHLVRLSPLQHYRLHVMGAYEKKSMMRFVNELIDNAWEESRKRLAGRGAKK